MAELHDNANSANGAPAPRLSAGDTAELVETISGLAMADLPLSAGLRAAAEEMPRRRVAAAMRHLATDLDRGVPLDAAVEGAGRNVPSYLRGLIFAGLRTGRVAHVLEELVAMDRDRVDLRRRIAAALAYPTILVILLIVMFVLANLFVVRPFARIYDEFGVELPTITMIVITMMHWFEKIGLGTMLLGLGLAIPSMVLLLAMPKPPNLQRACYRFPVLGPLWRWQSLVDFSRLMYLLLDRLVPMSEALRLTADGLHWSDLAEVSRQCAREIDQGMGLAESLAKHPEFPASIHPVIASGMKSQQPAEAFRAAAEMYRRRAGVDTVLWEAVLPPIILVFVAFGVCLLLMAMFLPMMNVFSTLT